MTGVNFSAECFSWKTVYFLSRCYQWTNISDKLLSKQVFLLLVWRGEMILWLLCVA